MARKASKRAKKVSKAKDLTPRFGIGEWFGFPLVSLTSEDRATFAALAQLKAKDANQLCPFQSGKVNAICSKRGGVCSIRSYTYEAQAVSEGSPARSGAKVTEGPQGQLRATCPNRFHEGLEVFKWVGEKILGDPDPTLVPEVGFLEGDATADSEAGADVGRIDMVLVKSNGIDGHPIAWSAVEIQAVYFSGDAMTGDFKSFQDDSLKWIPFPAGRRRPDYRSSAPKRLMPQLQIKVPTLRRWGKKMAVVVDRAFFNSMGEMDKVDDVSNADIAWFIIRFEEADGQVRAKLVRDEVRFTTLERSVEGLTGGKPVPLSEFEQRIQNNKAGGVIGVVDENAAEEAAAATQPEGAEESA